MFHPSYLLRNPSKEKGAPKWLTWTDMKEVKARLKFLCYNELTMSDTQEKQNKPTVNQQKSRNRRRRRRPDNRNKQSKNNAEQQKDGSNQRGHQQRNNQNNRNNNQNRNRQQRNKNRKANGTATEFLTIS